MRHSADDMLFMNQNGTVSILNSNYALQTRNQRPKSVSGLYCQTASDGMSDRMLLNRRVDDQDNTPNFAPDHQSLATMASAMMMTCSMGVAPACRQQVAAMPCTLARSAPRSASLKVHKVVSQNGRTSGRFIATGLQGRDHFDYLFRDAAPDKYWSVSLIDILLHICFVSHSASAR